MASRSSLAALIVGVSALTFTAPAQAGVIFTNEAAFTTAVNALGLTPLWAENFESFAAGVTPQVTVIGSGSAEIAANLGGGNTVIIAGNGGLVWVTNSAASPVIRGIGNTSLGVFAFGFNFNTQFGGNWNFDTSTGIEAAPANVGSNCCDTPTFVGWVAAPGQTLDSVAFSDNFGMAIDNIRALSSPVPEPGTLALLAVGLGLMRRRKAAPATLASLRE